MARWALAGDDHPSSGDDSDAEFDADDVVAEEPDQTVLDIPDAAATTSQPAPRKKISIKLGATVNHAAETCHVCGKKGHFSGFVGAKYIDCINKPCYLCGAAGHSTSTCPHRVAPGHGCIQDAALATNNIAALLTKREICPAQVHCCPAPKVGAWVVDAAVLKLHSRRTTCLEFHPRHPSLVISGDKKGQIAVWDLDKVFERSVYTGINRWLTNALRAMTGSDAACATASFDGTIKLFDIELGIATQTLFDANPAGWEQVVEEDKAGRWVTMMCCDVVPQGPGIVIGGDSKGRIVVLDPRLSSPAAELAAHKKNTKVQCVSVNPADPNVLLSAGNDYQARIWDLRCLTSDTAAAASADAVPGQHPAQVLALPHTKVINAAYFSPVTGRKIMTTAQDNRVRVWDNWTGDVTDPSRSIVHSHSFNRYLTPFRAEWDPKDQTERTAVIGRYISEEFGGQALHPVDVLDVATGRLVAELVDPNLTTISPVNKPHPVREVIVSGSSRSLYAWRPVGEREEGEGVGVGVDGREDGQGGAASGEGCSRWGASLPRGSASFVFFDAEEEGDKKKGGGKRKGKGEGEGSGGKKGKGKGPALDDDEEDE